MNEQHRNYLERIGMSSVLIERCRSLYEFYATLLPDEAWDIFVTELVTSEGTRQYDSLWFFSQRYAAEAKRFLAEDDFDFTLIGKAVYHWEIKKQDYDFRSATDKSRLSIAFHFLHEITGELKASKENCDSLRDVFVRYIMPNFIEG